MSSTTWPGNHTEPRGRLHGWGSSLFLGASAAAIATAPSVPLKISLTAVMALVALTVWAFVHPARWIGGFLAAALLLPPLPLALGDSGPHPCLFFAALGVLAGLLWLPYWRVPATQLNSAVAALWLLALLSIAPAAIYSGAPVAAASLLRVGLLAIPFYLFLFTAHGPARGLQAFPAIRLLYGAALVAALFACVDFYYQLPAPAGSGPQFVWLDSGVYRRAQGLFYEASTLGNFCSFFLVMIAVSLARPRAATPVSRNALAVGAIVLLAALVLSYSRGSLINLAVACSVLLWRYRKLNAKRLAAFACIGLVAGLATWKVFPTFVDAWWARLSSTKEYLFSASGFVLSGRLENWQTLASWIRENPWHLLWGIGYKTLPYTSYLGAPVIADNMYLSLLVETGIAGLAALVWLNFAILRAAARASRAADPQRSFCGAWMLCFWSGQIVQMLSGDLLTYWRVLPVYFFVLAMAVRS